MAQSIRVVKANCRQVLSPDLGKQLPLWVNVSVTLGCPWQPQWLTWKDSYTGSSSVLQFLSGIVLGRVHFFPLMVPPSTVLSDPGHSSAQTDTAWHV